MTDRQFVDVVALRNALYEADAITFEGVKIINSFPTADVAEVKQGVWKLHKGGAGVCSACNGFAYGVWDYDNWQHYCGRCGAKMVDVIKTDD